MRFMRRMYREDADKMGPILALVPAVALLVVIVCLALLVALWLL